MRKTSNVFQKFLLSVALLLCCTATANAYDAQIDGIYYNFDKANGTATVTSGGSKYEGEITIPAKVTYESKEYIVTNIGAAAFYMCRNLESITIPSGVTSIGDSTFYNCSNLATVTFAEGSKLESIGAAAFYNCWANLTSIAIPNSVKTIGDSAFAGCNALASITIPSGVMSIGDNAFAECSKLATVTFEEGSKLESIGAGAFANSYALASITIPSGVTSIGASAFYKNDALASITIPSSVTSIGDSTFYNCSNLASVTFAEGSKLESIGAAAFYNCWENLTSIVIPNSVKTIGDRAFAECNKLASITIPNSVTSIGLGVFNSCSKLQKVYINIVDFAKDNVIYNYFGSDKTIKYYYNGSEISGELVIPETTTSIGKNLLQGCTGLTSITIPSGVTSIGDSAFAECNALASVTFAEGSKLESIGAAAFYKNYALASITIPSAVTSIGDSAFAECDKLASITIPSSVTSIGDRAFAECDKLASVTFEEGSKLESIGAGAFANSYALASITIPNSVTSIGMSAFYNCSGLESITVQWTEAEKIPDISGKDVFEGITQSDVMLHVPLATKTLYKGTNVWKEFKLNEEIGILIVKADDSRIEQKFPDVSDFSIDESNNDIKNIVVSDDVDAVSSITYTRDFSNVAGKWQAWFVPFEAPISVLNEASIDVAEIAGILLNDEGETIVAFKKIEGDSRKAKANTPYVVRMGNDAPNKKTTLVFKNANLKETAESEYYAMSMYEKFTFTGNYESKAIANSYALNTEGEFQEMRDGVKLKPMRFSLSISSRDDSPYGSAPVNLPPKSAIRYMVLGDDSSLQPIDDDLTGVRTNRTTALKRNSQQTMRIYDLHGRKVNNIQSKQVYIIDGKTYTAR